MAKPFLSTEGREQIPILRGHVPDDLIARLEHAYSEADRINAIVSEVPGWEMQPRYRMEDCIAAQRDALKASKEIQRYLSLRWSLWRWIRRGGRR